MTEHYAGLATQIRDLERRLKEIDTKKANPSKVKEITETIKNLKDMLAEKKQKKEDRKKKKEEAAKVAEEAPKAEAAVQPTEVVKESAPAPTEVTKESDTTHFAIDAKVEPTRGTPGSWGTVIRSSGTNGDPLVYVKWAEGPLKSREEYGAYYESDLKMKVEKEAVSTDYVPREQVYNLEADLKSNYERMIADLQEEIQTAKDKAEYAWVGRLEEKLADIQKTYDEKYNKTAENENGSGGTTKLKVVDMNAPYDKDPQEKSIGYGGDRAYGWQTAPKSDESSLPLESSDHSKCEDKSETSHAGPMIPFYHGSNKPSMYCDKHVPSEKKASLNKDAKHTLKIKSLDDAQAECSEGDWHFSGTGVRTKEELEEQFKKHTHKEASLKFADLDLNSLEKRWALYVDGKLAIRTLTRSKAERIAKEKFPEQVAAGKYEIKREDHVPVEASLDKQAINITVAEKLFVVNPLGKTADNEYAYDVTIGSNNQKLFKITSKDEMGQEHLTYVIGKELSTNKEAASPHCAFCGQDFASYPEYAFHRAKGHKSEQMTSPSKEEIVETFEKKHPAIIGKLTSNLAFLKKGSFVSILAVDQEKKQVKFASLDNSLRGWAPMQKFSAMNVPESKLIDHAGHKDEILAESGKEILVTCPANSVNVEWRTVEAPPATPESLNPDVASLKEARGCDQCEMMRINGVPVHEKGCPKDRKVRDCDICGYPLTNLEDHDHEVYASLNIESHIRHEGDKWVVWNHDYTKKLGTYDTEEAAQKRLRQIEYFKHQGSLKPLSKKEAANVMDTPCEGCGEPLGPEVFLSKYPVCGKCTKKRHDKAMGKKAYDEISLEQQVQGFKDRMSAVTERLANPPAKTADLETTEDLSKVDVKDLSEGILHMIDLIESKVGTDVSADPELHSMLEELENKVYEVEMKLGIKPNLPEHEKLEPEHKEVVEEVEKESAVEVKSDNVNTPPTTLPPAGFRYAWDPKNMTWILVQISDAPGGGY